MIKLTNLCNIMGSFINDVLYFLCFLDTPSSEMFHTKQENFGPFEMTDTPLPPKSEGHFIMSLTITKFADTATVPHLALICVYM